MKITSTTTKESKTADIYSQKVSAHLRQIEPGLTTATVCAYGLEFVSTVFKSISEITMACVLKNGCKNEDAALMDILGFSEVPA